MNVTLEARTTPPLGPEMNDEEVLLEEYLQPGSDVSSLISFIAERLQGSETLRIVIYGQRQTLDTKPKLEVKLEQESSDEEENFENSDSELDDDKNTIPKILKCPLSEDEDDGKFERKASDRIVRIVCKRCCQIFLRKDLKNHQRTCLGKGQESEVCRI